jgi:GNAT superfamily N-acetyltransferase
MIRRLDDSDLEQLLAIRREALDTDPTAFSASPESDVGLDPEFVRASLARRSSEAIFGAFRDSDLVGMTGVFRERNQKEEHKAVVWGMFVRPAERGHGFGGALLDSAIRFAESIKGVTHLHIAVSENASSALRLYEAAGFTAWGVEAASLIVDQVPVAVTHMVLELTARGE